MKSWLSLCAVLIVQLVHCTSDNPVAGPSTELQNPKYMAVVLDSMSTPLPNAPVTVYKIVATTNPSDILDTLSIELYSLKTDSKGTFSLRNISAGEYLITSFSPDSTLTGQKRVLFVHNNDLTIHDTLILSSPGTIKGVISRGGQLSNSGNVSVKDGDIRVVLVELNQSTITGPNGTFVFSSVPAGVYTLAMYPDNSFFSLLHKPVVVSSGSITIIDTVMLERIPWVRPPKPTNLILTYDTSAAIVSLQWSRVYLQNLYGYIIERRFPESILEPDRFFTKDTTYTESLLAIPHGKQIFYSVRSVSIQYEESYPEGPDSIVVVH